MAITPSTIRPVWGTGLTITGTVSGAGSTPGRAREAGLPLHRGFAQIATATANSRGAFTLTAPPLFVTARLRVVTRTAVVATSPVTTASVAVKVGLKTQAPEGQAPARRGRDLARGAERPRLAPAPVAQRQVGLPQARDAAPLTGNRSRYRFIVARRSRAMNYRVVVLARDGGAHVPGTSRTLTIPKR